MVDAHSMVVSISRLGVAFLVPAVVWVTLIAGVLQLVFGGIRRLGIALPGTQRFAQRSARRL